ncbi:MAG: YraN family protein [Bacteroidetes bacterium]|nr:YraN family protein [Bacteroidota bacterium]
MKKQAIIGKNGEDLAKDFLIKKNYSILFSNWRHKRSEIDIIAKKDNRIIFVEVKVRNNQSFGFPEDFVDKTKIKKMHEAADAYIEEFDWKGELQFDIIAIENGNKITHFEDAFY